MKRKIISNTYLRDVDKYQIKLFLDEEDCYISVKKLIMVKERFIIKNNLCVMDNGYYILEIVPKKENYAMRLFLNQNKEPLEYYFDICKNNGLDEKTKIPYYDDLYLDITYLDGKINIIDEDELLEAYDNNEITKEELDFIYEIKDKIISEIKNKNNKLMNIDYSKYLDNF